MNEVPRQKRIPVRVRLRAASGVVTELHDVEIRPGATVADLVDGLARPGGAPEWGPRCDDRRCGACTVLVNGVPRPMCLTLAESSLPPTGPLSIEPLEKLAGSRDLLVDRSRLLGDLARSGVGLPPGGAGDSLDPDGYDRCTGCGACLEACPEYGAGRAFVGAAVLARLHRTRTVGPAVEQGALLDQAMSDGGLSDCGHSENCVEVCPFGVPLVSAMQLLSRAATRRLTESLLRRKPR